MLSIIFIEVDEFNGAVEMFNQGRAAFDPVAGVHVDNLADALDLGAMNVTADDALHVVFARRLHDGVLEIADVLYRRLGFVFQIHRDRPIPDAEPAPDAVKAQVKIQNPAVKAGSDAVEQAVELYDTVKLVAMEDKIASAVRGRVNDFARELHAAKGNVEKLFEEFVVIAREVDNLGLLAALAQQFLDKHVVAILPVPLGFQLPPVNEIADEVKIAAFGIAQKVHLGVLGAQVDVGNPDRAIAPWARSSGFRVGGHKLLSDGSSYGAHNLRWQQQSSPVTAMLPAVTRLFQSPCHGCLQVETLESFGGWLQFHPVSVSHVWF